MRRAKLLPGLAVASKRLADGSRRKYFYAWRSGPLLKDADGAPLQLGDPQLVVAYAAAHTGRKKPAQGTLFTLIALYKTTSEFIKRAERTKKDYLRFLKMIEDEFGTLTIRLLQQPEARGEFKEWRDGIANAAPMSRKEQVAARKRGEAPKPTGNRQADYAWGMLARVLSVAKDRGKITINVCERGGRLYNADRAEIIWQPAHITAFGAVASDELIFALVLALWTAQRQGDLIKLTWSQYDGTHIRLKQGKTKARVTIPVSGILKEAIDARRPEKAEGAILRNTRGQPWTEDGFRTSWGKACTKAGIDDAGLHFHDLRGTAVTRLALSGCTAQEIGAITGHSEKEVSKILEAHYIGGRIELAEQAIIKIDARYGSETNVNRT